MEDRVKRTNGEPPEDGNIANRDLIECGMSQKGEVGDMPTCDCELGAEEQRQYELQKDLEDCLVMLILNNLLEQGKISQRVYERAIKKAVS